MARIIPEPAATSGSSTSSGAASLVYRPGGAASDNVYTTWASLVTAHGAIEGPKIVRIDDSITSPALIPSGTYDFSDTIIVGSSETRDVPPIMQLEDGAVFSNLEEIKFIELIGNSISASFVVSSAKQLILRDCDINVTPGRSYIFDSSSTFDIVLDRTKFTGSETILNVSGGTTTIWIENQSEIITNVIDSAVASAVDVNYVDANSSFATQAGIAGASSVTNLDDSLRIFYDNTISGLVADNVKDAIDEVASGGGLTYLIEAQSTYNTRQRVTLTPVTATDDIVIELDDGTTSAFYLGSRADGTATGGNNRGAGAVDFQTSRAVASTVASGARSTILNGINNTAGSLRSTAWGESCIANNTNATAFGKSCQASGLQAASLGGESCSASGRSAATLGGNGNTATTNYAVAVGGLNCDATAIYSATLGGSGSTASNSYASVVGGNSGTASGQYASVMGGSGNTASGNYSTAIGGLGCNASGALATTIGGNTLAASGTNAAIVGGQNNSVGTGSGSAILGGFSNFISSGTDYAGILAGYDASISADYSVVLGGHTCNVTQQGGIAAGFAALADLPCTFALSANSDASIGVADSGESQLQLVHLDQRTDDSLGAPTPLTMDAAGTQITVGTDRLLGIQGKIICWNETDETATTFNIDVDVYYDGTTLTFLGGDGAQAIFRTDDAGVPAVSITNTGAVINITVTGINSKICRWSAALIMARAETRT